MEDESLFKVTRVEVEGGEIFKIGDMYATRKQIEEQFVIFEMHEDSPHELIEEFIKAVKTESPDLKFLVIAGNITIRKIYTEEII